MSYPLDFAKQKMNERQFPEYDVKPVLVEVAANSSVTLNESNDFHLMVNLFPELGVVNGHIEAENDALYLNAQLANTEYQKVKFLEGVITITNSAAVKLYVEFLRLTPVWPKSE